MQLHLEEYSEGYNGGTGFPPHDVFAVPNMTLSGKNVSVRKVLDVSQGSHLPGFLGFSIVTLMGVPMALSHIALALWMMAKGFE